MKFYDMACVDCTAKLIATCLPGMSQCLTHKLANQDRTDALRAAKAAAGVCRDCRCDAVPGRKQCERHLEAGRQRWLRRSVLPVAAPGSQGRCELSRIGTGQDNAAGGMP